MDLVYNYQRHFLYAMYIRLLRFCDIHCSESIVGLIWKV